MNSAPHLLNEDRQEFTRVLDEALRSASHRRDPKDLTPADSTLTTEQLRSMALSAMVLIAAAAAAEYQHYVKLRGELRTPAGAFRPDGTGLPSDGTRLSDDSSLSDGTTGAGHTAGAGGADSTADATRPEATGTSAATTPSAPSATSPRTTRDDGRGTVRTSGPGRGQDRGGLGRLGPAGARPGEPAGAGLTAVVAVLAPVLAGAAALIFLLVGYVMEMVGPAPAFAHTLLTTGWVFGAITAAAILFAAAGLLLTALRNSATSLRAEDRAELDAELDRAREAWRRALLERGILPFLQEAQVRSGTPRTPAADSRPPGRMPQLGYHSPGFSSRDDSTTARPRYSSPDYSSPDFGGPEHQPE